MPVLPSSNLHLDILTGKDETIDFEDFLNGKGMERGCVHREGEWPFIAVLSIDPALSTDTLDVHAAMEHKLKLKV
jgi:proteasome maturation protein